MKLAKPKLSPEQIQNQLSEDLKLFIEDDDLNGVKDMILNEGTDPAHNLCEQLRYATELGRLEIIDFFATLPRIHLNLMNGALLRIAVENNHNHIVEYLLNKNIDPNDYVKFPPLAIAVQEDNIKAMSMLLKKGAIIDAENHCALRMVQSKDALMLIGSKYKTNKDFLKVLKQFPLKNERFFGNKEKREELFAKIDVIRKMEIEFGDGFFASTLKTNPEKNKPRGASLLGSKKSIA